MPRPLGSKNKSALEQKAEAKIALMKAELKMKQDQLKKMQEARRIEKKA